MDTINLNGILPPVTTPFTSEGRLDLEGLARNVALYNETGVAGYVALGSNGEAVHLTHDETATVIRTIKSAAAPSRTIVVGVNEQTPRAALDSTLRAKDLGADLALVITPYYYKAAMTQDAFLRYFNEVADASPLPVLIYNVPQNTGVVIEPSSIASLSSHQNIVGVKDSAGNMAAIAETIRRTNKDFSVMVGNGSILYPSLMMGARGAILAVACAAPDPCVELHSAVRAHDHARALDLQNRLAALSHLVTAGLGVAGLKVAMEVAGFVGGPPRLPLLPVGAMEREKIKAVMRDSGLLTGME